MEHVEIYMPIPTYIVRSYELLDFFKSVEERYNHLTQGDATIISAADEKSMGIFSMRLVVVTYGQNLRTIRTMNCLETKSIDRNKRICRESTR